MIRDALSHLGGVGVYGVISICLFFAVFLSLMIWAFRLKKPWLNAMSRLPLEPDDDSTTEAMRTSKPRHDHD
jgi:cytochrome c oxidase cbb3-type subunit IV